MLDTVNVIEIIDTNVVLTSFPNTPEGNQQAKDLFRILVRENRYKKNVDIERCVDDGYFLYGEEYQVLLVHSNVKE